MGAEQGAPGMVHPAPEEGKPMTERCAAAAAEMAAK